MHNQNKLPLTRSYNNILMESGREYSPNPDPRVNANGRDLISLCKSNKLIPLNHMKNKSLTCDGTLTFKRSGNWISQLDWTLCSESLTRYVIAYNILTDTPIATDHALLQCSGKTSDTSDMTDMRCYMSDDLQHNIGQNVRPKKNTMFTFICVRIVSYAQHTFD